MTDARPDPARTECFKGWHDDPDNSGLCIYCCLILDPDEDPNAYRLSQGWTAIPVAPDLDRDD